MARLGDGLEAWVKNQIKDDAQIASLHDREDGAGILRNTEMVENRKLREGEREEEEGNHKLIFCSFELELVGCISKSG